MRSILSVLGLATTVFSISTFASDLPNYEYWVRVPAAAPANLENCQKEAANLELRFIASTGIKSAQAVCKSIVTANFDGAAVQIYSLLVNYQSQAMAPIYSATVGGMSDFSSKSSDGPYKTYSECLSDLDYQTRTFASETGLNAVSSFCLPDATAAFGGYLLQVDGFGEPAKKLGVFHLEFGQADHSINQNVFALLKSQADVIRTSGDATYYYSAAPLKVVQEYFGLFKDQSQCDAQLESARAIFVAAGSRSTQILNCVTSPGAAFELDGIADGNFYLNHDVVLEQYYSFDECLQDRERMIQKSGGHDRIYGAICTPDITKEAEFSMELFGK